MRKNTILAPVDERNANRTLSSSTNQGEYLKRSQSLPAQHFYSHFNSIRQLIQYTLAKPLRSGNLSRQKEQEPSFCHGFLCRSSPLDKL